MVDTGKQELSVLASVWLPRELTLIFWNQLVLLPAFLSWLPVTPVSLAPGLILQQEDPALLGKAPRSNHPKAWPTLPPLAARRSCWALPVHKRPCVFSHTRQERRSCSCLERALGLTLDVEL